MIATRRTSGIRPVIYNLLRGVALCIGFVVAAATGISQAQEHAETSYGRWGFDESGVDPRINPGDSFFDFANGAWEARAEIPADKARYGTFDALTDKTQVQIRPIV